MAIRKRYGQKFISLKFLIWHKLSYSIQTHRRNNLRNNTIRFHVKHNKNLTVLPIFFYPSLHFYFLLVSQKYEKSHSDRQTFQLKKKVPSPKLQFKSYHRMATSAVSISSICFPSNPAPFLSTLQLEVTYQVTQPLSSPLQWRVIYVGSAMSESYDQILEEFEIAPTEERAPCRFVVDCSPPDFKKIPLEELLSITALIITASYKQQEFARIGYYVHNMLPSGIQNRAERSVEEITRLATRTILINKPRITLFKIDWGTIEKKQPQTPNRVRGDHSNSLLSSTKTACNEKDPNFSSQLFLKKQKKIKKQKRRQTL